MANFNKDLLKQLFTYDTVGGGLLWAVQTGSKNKVGNRFGYSTPSGYRKGMVKGISVREHRLVWIFWNGDIPEGLQIDHIDGNTYNNRIENLRLATHAENLANQTISKNKTSSKYKGVYYQQNKYIFAMYGKTYIGMYKTEEEAARAYDAHTILVNKEFAKTNF